MRSILALSLVFACSLAMSSPSASGQVSESLNLKALNPGKPGNILSFEDDQGCRYVVGPEFVPGKDVVTNMRACKGKKWEEFRARAKNVAAFEVGQVVVFERL